MLRTLLTLATLAAFYAGFPAVSAFAVDDEPLQPPELASLDRLPAGDVGVTLTGVVEVSGFNVYRGSAYVTTVRPALGVSEFEVDVGSAGGQLCLVAFDEGGAEEANPTTRYSSCSNFVAVDPADPDQPDGALPGPPSPPPGLRAVIYSPGVVELFWERSEDDGRVVAYRVTRDGEEVAYRNGQSHFETGLSTEEEVEFKVTAIDDDGNESDPAMLLVIAVDGEVVPPTPGGEGGEPPPAGGGEGVIPEPAANLRATVYSPGVAEIFWDKSPDEARLAGYELLRDGQRVAFRRGRSHFESALVVGELYEYALTAIHQNGNRSETLTLALRAGEPEAPARGFEVYLTPERLSLLEGQAEGVDVEVTVQRADGTTAPLAVVLLDAGGLPIGDAYDEAGAPLEARFDRTTLPGLAATESARLNLSLAVGMAPRRTQQRTLFVRVGEGAAAIDVPLTIEIEPIDVPDVYLLIGQSNMEGYSEPGSKMAGAGEPDEPVDRVLQLHVESSNPRFFAERADFVSESTNVHSPLFITAEDPLHDRLWPGQPAKSGTFIGPGLSFAKAALTTTEQDIYLIPAAWGATGFCGVVKGDVAWNAEPSDIPEIGGTWLLERALLRLRMTLRETGGILRGILWHQGGADSNNQVCGEQYADNIVKMVERLRREAPVDARGPAARGNDAPIPFIVATQSRGADERADFSFYGPPKVLVDTAHRSIGSLLPYADVVINDDLVPPAYPCGQGSCVHFGAAALREQGLRFQAALQRVRQAYANAQAIGDES